MSDPPMLSLAKLLESVGLGTSVDTRLNRSRVMTHEMKCQIFATTLVKTFSAEKAYRAAHPSVMEGKRKARWIRRRAATWLAKDRVMELVSQMWDQVAAQHQFEMRLMYEQMKEDTQQTIEPFLGTDEKGYAHGIKFKPSELTPAQLRSIKSFERRPTRWGDVVKLQMYDRQQSQSLFMHATELMSKVGNGSEGGSVPSELMRSLETLADRREQALKSLPPSRVRIIEGESTPV